MTDEPTGTTLYQLLNDPTDPTAWEAFVDRYGPKVYRWCRGHRLQDADAQNVTQEVLLRLARGLHTFDARAGRFRNWLRAVTRNAWNDYCRTLRPGGIGSGDTAVLEQLESAEAREDLVRTLEEEFDLELLEEAKLRARLRVEPQTWQAFELLALGGLSGAEAAARLGMKVAAVFVARSRVQRLIQEEIARLDGGGPGDATDG
jgi:RNA polymerase sigma-70 factor (ECF subfamily)